MNTTDITQRIALAGVGREVVLADGTYTIDKPVRPLAGQTLRASSRGGVVFQKTADVSLIEVMFSGIAIDGIRLDGRYDWTARSGPKGNGIYAHSVSGLRVRNCWTNNIYSGGIVMTATRDSRITNNFLDGCGSDSVYGTPSIFGNFDCVDHLVEENVITMRRGGPHAIGYHTEAKGYTVERVRILNNQIVNNGGGYCIEVGSFAQSGSDAERPRDILIADNSMLQTANASGGISMDWCDSATVSRNHFRAKAGTANAGIECVNGRYVRIESNQVYGGGQVSIGIALDHECSSSQVVGNIICDILPSAQGKYIAARAIGTLCPGIACYRHLLIQGNYIEAPAGADGDGIRIFLEDDKQILQGVRIIDNQVFWRGAGGPNSSAVVMGSPIQNANMSCNVIRANDFRNTHFGMYLQGFNLDIEPDCGENKMVGVLVPEHRE